MNARSGTVGFDEYLVVASHPAMAELYARLVFKQKKPARSTGELLALYLEHQTSLPKSSLAAHVTKSTGVELDSLDLLRDLFHTFPHSNGLIEMDDLERACRKLVKAGLVSEDELAVALEHVNKSKYAVQLIDLALFLSACAFIQVGGLACTEKTFVLCPWAGLARWGSMSFIGLQ